MSRKKTSNIEYADAPSGFVTFYNYKEPLIPFKQGHGFEGVLLMDGKSPQVQCHFCGKWFDYLSHHIHREHALLAPRYKELTGLLPTSALIGEKFREKLIRSGLSIRLKNLRINRGHSNATKKKISKSLRATSERREYQNIRGTCPAQLISRLRALGSKLGHQPSKTECNFFESVTRVFGSWQEGLRLAQMIPRSPGGKIRFTDEAILHAFQAFKTKHGRCPGVSDFKRKVFLCSLGTINKRFGGLRKMVRGLKFNEGDLDYFRKI